MNDSKERRLKFNSKRMWFFLMLGIPAVLIGGVALYFLGAEQERLEKRLQADTQVKAEVMAQKFMLAIERIQTQVMAKLRTEMPSPSLNELVTYRDQEPLVRNVFLWNRPSNLSAGVPGAVETEEEQRFKRVFQSLFSRDSGFADQMTQAEFSAMSQAANLSSSYQSTNRAVPVEFGWKVWFWNDRFSWLGWTQDRSMANHVFGVELETLFVLSNAIETQVKSPADKTVYQLVDHNGKVFHQTGQPPEKIVSRFEKPLGKNLPGWTLLALSPAVTASGYGFFGWPARLLIVLLVMAVLLGAWLLFNQADRAIRNATQKTNFVANVSHELKTPLTSICMYAELLASGRITDVQKQAHYLKVVVQQTQRLTRLVNNVLTFGHLEQGKKPYHMTKIDMAGVVERVLEAQKPRLESKNIQLETQVVPVRVMADADALSQVLLNLLDNAVKYGCDEKGPANIAILVREEAGYAELWVMDHGPGIPVKWRKAVFEKFFRLDDRLVREKSGSGIGLSIAHLLMKDMAGSLGCEPQKGYGACFVARLPRLRGES